MITAMLKIVRMILILIRHFFDSNNGADGSMRNILGVTCHDR